jgi:hypothetical protein
VRIHLRRRFGATTALRAGLGTRELRLKNPEEREDAPPRNIWLPYRKMKKILRVRKTHCASKSRF